jgi:hypothetical protein
MVLMWLESDQVLIIRVIACLFFFPTVIHTERTGVAPMRARRCDAPPWVGPSLIGHAKWH